MIFRVTILINFTNTYICSLQLVDTVWWIGSINYFSQLKMQALSPLADKLKEHHTRLVFIGSSTVDQMEEFMRSPTVLMSGELYSDPTTSLYKTFHMKRGRFRSLVMPIWNSVSRYGWGGALEGKLKYMFFTYNWHVF